tara:strand:+ start:4749 stop:6368 length:1620 start_codon:yes stop_codon:yes gene_type:complete
MKKLLILFLLFFAATLVAQENIKGEISFISGDNIYIRFADTKAIEKGDTLFYQDETLGAQACLIVENKSSVSCIAKQIGDCALSKGQQFFLNKTAPVEEAKDVPKLLDRKEEIRDTSNTGLEQTKADKKAEFEKRERISARVSAASYTIFAPDNKNKGNTRFIGRVNFAMDNISESNFSVESYFNYQENMRLYDEFRGYNRRFNVYNLALTYKKENVQVSIGRKINRKASSLGAIDGLQGEYNKNGYFVGALAGFRPDYQNFGLNTSLFQYGAYLGLEKGGKKFRSQITAGFLEQRNQGAIDRRFIYLQTSNQVGSRLNVFASTEVDLYENYDSVAAQSILQLSSLFISSSLKITDWWRIFGSYDTRRQIIFFETYDTEVERLLADQEARQGLRARSNFSIGKRTNLGLSYNSRFQQNAGKQGENIQAYISYNRVPWIGGTFSYRFNINSTLYLRSEVNSARYSHYFAKGKLYTAVYYRYLSYLYLDREIVVPAQAYYGAELSYRMNSGWDLGTLGEMSKTGQQTSYRINVRLTKRFKF